MTIIILQALAAYAMAYVLVNERGPGHVFERLRGLAGVVDVHEANSEELERYLELSGLGIEDELPDQIATTEVGLMLLCMYCTGLWTNMIALLLSPAPYGPDMIFRYLAACGVYILLIHLVEVLNGLESWIGKD